jgi:hypothetical protein
MKRIVLASVAAIAFVGGRAVAADFPMRSLPIQNAPGIPDNWTGFYVANGGAAVSSMLDIVPALGAYSGGVS